MRISALSSWEARVSKERLPCGCPVYQLTWVSHVLQRAAQQGASLGVLVDLVLDVDPSILVTSLLATTTVFVCFGGSALLSKRRSYLYLGGVLSSVISGEHFPRGVIWGRCIGGI